MKPILISSRVDTIEAYGERRDALDQNWVTLLITAGYLPIVLPNAPDLVASYLDLQPQGIVLSGGNSLLKYGGDAPERDLTERALLEYAIDQSIPVLGVCRGMQLIMDHFGGVLEAVDGHVSPSQEITVHGKATWVNSYHDWGSQACPKDFEVWARSSDGIIKAIKHKTLLLTGIMWHPERILPFRKDDITLLQAVFQ